MRNTYATTEKKLLQVVAFQVPDEVQAHRCNITDHLPPRIRTVQPRVLVHVPVSGGGRRRVNSEDEEDEHLGTRNDVARGHLYHSHTRHRARNQHSHHGNNRRQPSYHSHSHHQHNNSFNRPRHRQQHSPTSSTHTADGDAQQCSPSGRSSRIPSRDSTSPVSSRVVTPSPPPLLHRTADKPKSKFSRLPLSQTEKCCFGLIPTRYFTCHAKGSARIDVLARFAFPLMFVVFNFAYWSMYLFRGEEENKMS